jgi:hypothetical protein
MTGPFGPFRAIRIVLGGYPGRRFALPWARLCKPVGLSKPLALRANEPGPVGLRKMALRAVSLKRKKADVCKIVCLHFEKFTNAKVLSVSRILRSQ